jgi:acetyl-CoA synthetase
VGRDDDVIKSSGYRIGPFEVESALIEHPAVTECAVVGAPDPKGVRGIIVKAVITLTKGYKPSAALTKELQEYVKKTTAPYKYPRIIEYVDELPKTISGKILRRKLRKN